MLIGKSSLRSSTAPCYCLNIAKDITLYDYGYYNINSRLMCGEMQKNLFQNILTLSLLRAKRQDNTRAMAANAIYGAKANCHEKRPEKS